MVLAWRGLLEALVWVPGLVFAAGDGELSSLPTMSDPLPLWPGGLMLLCLTDDRSLRGAYGSPGAVPHICLPRAVEAFQGPVHLSFAALGC